MGGTDEYAGQFYCAACWRAFDPKVQEIEKEDQREAAEAEKENSPPAQVEWQQPKQEARPNGHSAPGGYPHTNGARNTPKEELSPGEAQRKAAELMRQEEEVHRRVREEQQQRQAEQDQQRLRKLQEDEQRRQRAAEEQN